MVKNIFLSLCLVVTVSCLSLYPCADAQSAGSISGVVTDQSQTPVSGAKVTLKSKQLQFKDSGTTGSNGEYEFSGLDAGKYTIKVNKSGYKKKSKQIKLKEGQSKVFNIQLKTQGSGNGSGNGSGSGSGSGSGGGSGSGSGSGA